MFWWSIRDWHSTATSRDILVQITRDWNTAAATFHFQLSNKESRSERNQVVQNPPTTRDLPQKFPVECENVSDDEIRE